MVQAPSGGKLIKVPYLIIIIVSMQVIAIKVTKKSISHVVGMAGSSAAAHHPMIIHRPWYTVCTTTTAKVPAGIHGYLTYYCVYNNTS